MDESTIEVTSRDCIQLQVYRWAPDGEPRAVVQIQHGLGEHALRLSLIHISEPTRPY